MLFVGTGPALLVSSNYNRPVAERDRQRIRERKTEKEEGEERKNNA